MSLQYPSFYKMLSCGHIDQGHFLSFLQCDKLISTVESLAQSYWLQMPTPIPATILLLSNNGRKHGAMQFNKFMWQNRW